MHPPPKSGKITRRLVLIFIKFIENVKKCTRVFFGSTLTFFKGGQFFPRAQECLLPWKNPVYAPCCPYILRTKFSACINLYTSIRNFPERTLTLSRRKWPVSIQCLQRWREWREAGGPRKLTNCNHSYGKKFLENSINKKKRRRKILFFLL